MTDLVLAAKTSVTGPGTVKAAAVAADGVSFEKAPEQQTVAPEVTVPPVVTPVVIPVVPTPGGGGGYTPPSKIALTITDPTVTLSRVYDGTRNATVTATGALTGVVTGDDVRVTATAAYDSKAAGSDKRITVTYALVGTAASKYSAPVNKTMAGGTILPAPLTVSGTTITPTKEYDGTTAASCTLGTITGKITTDNLTVDAAAVYATRDIGTGKPVTLTYTLGGNDAGNYTAPAGDSNTTGEITCKTLTVLDNTQLIQFDKVYDGSTAIPGLAGELAATAINGVVPGDTVVVTPSGMFTDPNVGVHDINVSFTLSGTNADHYQINPKTITGKIVPTPLTAADTVVTTSKTYDGETTATITAPGSIGGIISADLSKVTVTPVASFDNKNAGSGKTITVTYTLEGDVAGNYSKPADAKLNTGVITAKPLTIEAPNLTTSKEYDSEVTALVSAGNLIGVIGTDAVTPKATASYNDKAAAENKTITVVYTLDGADKANYTAPADFTNTTGKITPKQLTNSLNTLTTEKVYNGTNSVDANGGDLVGVLEGDMVVRVIEAVYNTKDVGDTKTITISYPINGLDAANYLAPIPVVRTDGKITPKPLTVTGVEVTTTKAYNGDTIAAVTNNGTISGIFSDDYVVKVTPVAHYNDASAGENKTITVSFNKTGDDAGNYIVPAAYDYATNGIIN
ncbi:MAG: hypothetical protein CVV55_00075 [Synergistetes bacterium HGW-Synergistetes-2]|nr:MAG: hypothetical protein CVV55_00075 [Synergistetes bacterium HGW-Synergistetes-2]